MEDIIQSAHYHILRSFKRKQFTVLWWFHSLTKLHYICNLKTGEKMVKRYILLLRIFLC